MDAFGVMLRLEEKLTKKSPEQPSFAGEGGSRSVVRSVNLQLENPSVSWTFKLAGGTSRKID